MALKPKDGDFVSNDKDWRSVITNELRSAKQWEDDWGFLVSGQTFENDSIDAKIQKLESRLTELDQTKFRTTSGIYGKGNNLERYRVTENNIIKNPDLRPCDRKPKRNRG